VWEVIHGMVREGEELWPGEEGDEFLDYYSRYRPLANRYSLVNQNATLSQGADSLPLSFTCSEKRSKSF
jgi:hypothetical protein